MFRITSGKLPSGLGIPATFATGISPMAPLNLTNVLSAITDEAKDPPMRTIRISANKLLFINHLHFLFYFFLGLPEYSLSNTLRIPLGLPRWRVCGILCCHL